MGADGELRRGRSGPPQSRPGAGTTVLALFSTLVAASIYHSTAHWTGYIAVDLSFAINLAILLWAIWWHQQSQLSLFNASFLAFSFAWFWAAPVAQTHNVLLGGGTYPNTMSLAPAAIVLTNATIALFTCTYLVGRTHFGRRRRGPLPYIRLGPYAFATYALLTISVLVPFVPEALSQLQRDSLSDRASWEDLIVRKTIFALPIFFVMHLAVQWAALGRSKTAIALFAWVLVAALFKGPFIEKRNAVGPIALTALALLLRKKLSNARVTAGLILVILVAYPLVSAATHIRETVSLNEVAARAASIRFPDHLQALDFDAWSQLAAAIDYVDNRGMQLGERLAGALLFFVPRSTWEGKPIGSGHVLGHYLMSRYDMWFDNMSAPLVAEGYLDFGILGVFIYALALAAIGNICDRAFTRGGVLGVGAAYCSFHLVFLLRGALMSSIAYLAGMLVALVLLPLLVRAIFVQRSSEDTVARPAQ